MHDKDGKLLSFESDAYHAGSFCKEHDIKFGIIEREEDFDTLWKKAKIQK